MLSNEQIKKLQDLYKKHIGMDISAEEAYQSGAKLIRLIELIYKPMTKEEFQKVQRLRNKIKNSIEK